MRKKGLTSKPDASPTAQKELDKCEKQFDQFEKEIKDLTLDSMNAAPKEEASEVKVSQKDLQKSKDLYIKPKRTVSSKEKFNEAFRSDYNFAKEPVHFMAENKEIIGETINMWTKPFPGMPAEEWEIPTNKPIWAPRYVAEQIKKCTFHRLVMEDRPVSADHAGSYYGTMISKNTIQRLDAHPISERKSVFMGASSF